MMKQGSDKKSYYGESQNAGFVLPLGFLGGVGDAGSHDAGIGAFTQGGNMPNLLMFAEN